VESKTRANAIAERFLGAGEMHASVIYVDYGSGIGAGIILDGRLMVGDCWAAGEFGHTHIMEGGPACKCGSFGCLEAIAGADALGARVRQAVQDGSVSVASELAGGDPSTITGWTVLDAARRGDKTCSAVVKQAANYLGLGVANLVNLFNPSVVVLDHRLDLAGEDFLDRIADVVKIQALIQSTEKLKIRYGKMGGEAGVIGVGLIVLEKHFEVPALKLPQFMIESAFSVSDRHSTVSGDSQGLRV